MVHGDGMAVQSRPSRNFPRPFEGGMLEDGDVHNLTKAQLFFSARPDDQIEFHILI